MSKFLFLFILLIGCSATKKLNSNYIELQRTPCFGFCPDYKLTLFENGEYVFKGSGFVLKKKTEKGKISPLEVNSLFVAIDSIGFISYPNNIDDLCVSTMSDQPKTKITIAKGETKKLVQEQSCVLLVEPFLESYRYRVESGILTQQELDSMIVQSKQAELLLNQFHRLANQIDSLTNSKVLVSKLNKYQ
ncbi:MAG: DUF6438 domain-containing protein [Balneola sp.]